MTYSRFFSEPANYLQKPVMVDSRLATEISHLVQITGLPCNIFHAIFRDRATDFGDGFVDQGVYHGFGASFHDPSLAMVKSLFEAAERKFSRSYDPNDLVYSSANKLGDVVLNPRQLAPISDWEWERGKGTAEYRRYQNDIPIHWTPGYQLKSSELTPALLPAFLTFSQFSWRHPAERFGPNLSPGLAAHTNLKASVLNGMLETIERDAFMVAWLRRESPAFFAIDKDSDPMLFQVKDFLEQYGLRLILLDLTTDIDIPVVAAYVMKSDTEVLTVGVGCDLNASAATQKAIEEVLVLMAARIQPERPTVGSIVEDGVKTCRVDFSLEQNSIPLPWLAADAFTGTLEEKFVETVRRIEASGREVFYADLTPKKLTGQRFCLTRAFVTNLQPMLYEDFLWRLNFSRINSCRFKHGQACAGFDPDELNLSSHPFHQAPTK